MRLPENYRYTREHEWAKEEDGIIVVGITDYAQEKLGDIVFVELPQEGTKVDKDQSIAVVESTKNASDVYAPVSGVIIEVNSLLEENPEIINNDPYEEGWIVKIQPDNLEDFNDLLTADDYRQFLEELEMEGEEE